MKIVMSIPGFCHYIRWIITKKILGTRVAGKKEFMTGFHESGLYILMNLSPCTTGVTENVENC
jgi:hypothetical protein